MERSVIRDGLSAVRPPRIALRSIRATNPSRRPRPGAIWQASAGEAAVQRLVRHLLLQDRAHRDQAVEIDAGRKTLALAKEHEVLENHIAGGAGRKRAAAETAE